MSLKKIAYIISDIDKAFTFEWLAVRLRSEYDLFFVLIGKKDTALSSFLLVNSVRFYIVDDQQHPSYFSKWRKVFTVLRLEKPHIVHTHLWRANLIGLSTAWVLRVRRRIFTRHHSTIHYREFRSGRKWDLFCNAIATDIIAISRNVKTILTNSDKASPSKIQLIHHGFDLSYFNSVEKDRVDVLREKYRLTTDDSPVIGVISRYLEWKGVQYIIPAFKKLLTTYPLAHLVLANANGNYKTEIQKALHALPDGSFTEIGFETDIAALYRTFTVYVHAPVDTESEAFGQTYVESLASEIPSVFTLSGVATEFIVHEENALVVEFKDSESIYNALERLLSDQNLRSRLMTNGKKSVKKLELEGMVRALENLYSR